MTTISNIQEQAALINYGIFSTNPLKRKRYELLQSLQGFTYSKYQKWCNVLHDGIVAIADAEGHISLRNVQTCQSRHSCPVCTNRFMAEQRSKLNLIVKDWQIQGGAVVMGTLTLPNRTPMDFRYSYSRLVEVGSVFRRLIKKLEREIGVPISIRIIEETIQKGRGLHAHFHFLWLLPLGANTQGFMMQVKRLWLQAAKSKGLSGTSANAQNLKVVQPSDGVSVVSYITKHGYTPTSDASDLALNSPLSAFEVLVAAATGDLEWIELWRLFEAAVKGKRRITVYKNTLKDD
jgi:hypothetical protein